MNVEVMEKEPVKEMEVTCTCGRKIKIKFLSPVIIEQSCEYEVRGENSIP